MHGYIATCLYKESIDNVNDGFTRRGLFDLTDLIIRFAVDLRRVLKTGLKCLTPMCLKHN